MDRCQSNMSTHFPKRGRCYFDGASRKSKIPFSKAASTPFHVKIQISKVANPTFDNNLQLLTVGSSPQFLNCRVFVFSPFFLQPPRLNRFVSDAERCAGWNEFLEITAPLFPSISQFPFANGGECVCRCGTAAWRVPRCGGASVRLWDLQTWLESFPCWYGGAFPDGRVRWGWLWLLVCLRQAHSASWSQKSEGREQKSDAWGS